MGGSLFTPYQQGKFLYLYDWILQPGGQTCGVQFSPDGEAVSVAQWLSCRTGLRELKGEIYQIFFPRLSAELCYTDELDNQIIAEDVFEGTNGSFALALELTGIEEEAVRRLGAKTPAAGTELVVIDPWPLPEEIRKERESAVRPKFHIPFLGRLFGGAGGSSG